MAGELGALQEQQAHQDNKISRRINALEKLEDKGQQDKGGACPRPVTDYKAWEGFSILRTSKESMAE